MGTICSALAAHLLRVLRSCFVAPQKDLTLPEHGYVRVTYQASLHDPDGRDVSLSQLWHPLIPDGRGGHKTDPKGLIFMAPNLEIDLSEPAPIEKWQHGDIGDAEGLAKNQVWKKRRVMKDILEHRMQPFTKEQKDQWRALKEFHDTFTCSDGVPSLPLTLRAGIVTLGQM